MPTIRRPPTPSWRKRKFFGHACETLITRSNLDLECDRWFHESDLTDAARELFLKLSLTAWFVRLPGERQHFATLVELTGHHPSSQAIRDAAGCVPLTATSVRGDHQHIDTGSWHYSFIAGHAQAYLNGNPEWCWDGLKPYLEMMAMPPEDRDAFKDI
ncbi:MULTISPECIES: hypothetical protein [unclassified Methylobacterium]|uniref:hypothetical protein n=1 Tax=unclassified Methylobacterium TaxID=2615210 RepID=UPI0022699ABE|nr:MULTISPECIES: hypothetical protein [unclassified Methylobacterium]